MPSKPVNYSAVSIYKLCCKDTTVTDLYVGHTTSVVDRRKAHKRKSLDVTATAPVYVFIRNHGGWENWQLVEIVKISCDDREHALRVERDYIEQLGATLNTLRPIITREEALQQKKSNYLANHEENKNKAMQRKNANRDAINARARELRLNNIDAERERQRINRMKPSSIATKKKYDESHKEELAQYRRDKYLKKRETLKEQIRREVLQEMNEERECKIMQMEDVGV